MQLDYDTQFIKRIAIKREEVHSYDAFPFNLPVMRQFEEIRFHPNVTYIVGENGMGKSTLLEAIAIGLGFNPEGGTMNFNFSSYDSHSNLHEYLRIAKGVIRPKDNFFFRAESYYNLATNIEEIGAVESYGGKSLHELSHGESYFATFMHRFGGGGLYILDEPEAALSPLRQFSLLARIHELVKDGSQFIISTHSPILMAYPESKIIELSEEGMEEKSLEETNHYQMMKQFMENRDRMLHHLFES